MLASPGSSAVISSTPRLKPQQKHWHQSFTPLKESSGTQGGHSGVPVHLKFAMQLSLINRTAHRPCTESESALTNLLLHHPAFLTASLTPSWCFCSHARTPSPKQQLPPSLPLPHVVAARLPSQRGNHPPAQAGSARPRPKTMTRTRTPLYASPPTG